MGILGQEPTFKVAAKLPFDAIQFPEVELLSLYINIVKWFAALRQAGRCLSGLNKPSSDAFIHHQPIEVGSP